MQIVRESLFVSGLRSFCNAFFSFIGVIVGLIILLLTTFFVLNNRMNHTPRTELILWPDAQGNRKLLPPNTPVILCLEISGVIGTHYLRSNIIEEILLDSREDIFQGNRIKGILLHINSPGGLATEADDIYRHLMQYKKKYGIPIYGYIEGLCASGGMYIAAATDELHSSPSSVIGSIGVLLGPNFNFSGLMEKYGVSQKTLTEGKDKDMLNPYRPWQPGEDQSLINVNIATYDRFVDIVTKARPRLNREKLVNEYGAQVFIAKKAQELGYIDFADSDYNQALSSLLEKAEISQDQSYQVIKIAPVRNIINELIQTKFNINHRIDFNQKSESSTQPLLLFSS